MLERFFSFLGLGLLITSFFTQEITLLIIGGVLIFGSPSAKKRTTI